MDILLILVVCAESTFVLEHDADGRLTPAGPVLPWARAFVGEGCDAAHLAARSPFLETFLEEARTFWAAGAPGSLCSGPWTEHAAAHSSDPLEAVAVVAGRRRFLVLCRLGEGFHVRQAMFQAARSSLLEQERLQEEVRNRTRDIRHRDEEIVLRLATAAGLRDGETGAHVRRIGLCSATLARALGWSTTQVDEIRVAAPLHDAGKIGVPDGVLRKPGPLTDGERAIMRTHCEIGARLLGDADIPLLRMARDIAWCHHERWDGKGYPRNLAADAIPEAARIVAVVDVFDAMLSRRIYKEPIPEPEVLQYIAGASRMAFDPRVVDAFFSALPEIRLIQAQVPDELPQASTSLGGSAARAPPRGGGGVGEAAEAGRGSAPPSTLPTSEPGT